MNSKLLTLFFFLLCTTGLTAADLELSGGTVQTLGGFQTSFETWASLNFNLKNNSSKERHLKLQFRHTTKPEGIYEYLLTIPPKTKLKHSFPVSMGSAYASSRKEANSQGKSRENKKRNQQATSAYNLTMLEKSGDRYVPVKGNNSIACNLYFQDFGDRKSIAFLTDRISNIGNLSKKLGLKNNSFRMAYVNQTGLVNHWSEYSSFDALVMLEPNLEAFSPLVTKALKNFVKMGGTLIFANENVIMGAAKTELEDLLPIIPLHVRSVNHNPTLQKFFGIKEKVSAEFGMTFVESIAKKHSFTAASWNEYPMVVWKKYGLGMTVAINASPTNEALNWNYGEGFKQVWSYLTENTAKPIDLSLKRNDNAREAVNMLNGLTIPSPGVILNYLIVYIVLALIIFIIFMKMRKTPLGWVANIVLALLMTAFIFNKAYSTNSSSTNRTAAVLVQTPLVDDAPLVKFYSIFSKNNDEITLTGDSQVDRFRKLPNVKVHYNFMNNKASTKKKKLNEVITSLYDGKTASLSKMNVQGLSARTLLSLSQGHNSGSLPAKLSWNPEGLTINSDEFPSELESAENIYLGGANGLIALEMKSGVLVTKENQQASPGVETSLRKVILSLSPRQPLLFFYNKDLKKDKLLNESYTVNGLNLYMTPLIEKLHGDVLIPGVFVKFTFLKNSKFLNNNGVWQSSFQRGKKQKYQIQLKLPLGYENLKTKEIIVDMKYTSGGNVSLEVLIAGKKGQKNDQGLYVFKNLPASAVKNGVVQLSLESNRIAQIKDLLKQRAANIWKMEHLKVSFKGTFGPQLKATEF